MHAAQHLGARHRQGRVPAIGGGGRTAVVLHQGGQTGRLHGRLDPKEHPEIDASAFDGSVLDQLNELQRRLPQDLDLADQHFLFGISQMAIGADMIFTRACKVVSVPQQLFLPQHREDYLAATGSRGITVVCRRTPHGRSRHWRWPTFTSVAKG